MWSQGECVLSRNAMQWGVRADGRSNFDERQVNAAEHAQPQLLGSLRLRLPFDRVDIWVGVKIQLSAGQSRIALACVSRLTKQEEAVLAVMQECLQQQLIARLQTPSQLTLHIDVCFACLPHPALLQLTARAVLHALSITVLPDFALNINSVTQEQTVDILQGRTKMEVKGVKAWRIVGVLGTQLVVDLTPLQYQAVDAVVLLVSSESGVVAVQLLKGSIRCEVIHQITKLVK